MYLRGTRSGEKGGGQVEEDALVTLSPAFRQRKSFSCFLLRQEEVLIIVHAEIEAKDSASGGANRMGATVHSCVAYPLRGIDGELGLVARRSAAGA